MISVVIPVYNSGEYVVAAVKSAITQDVDKEIVVVDDASTDGCIEHLISYLDELSGDDNLDKAAKSGSYNGETARLIYSRNITGSYGMFGDISVRIYRNDRNLGVADTRNLGVELAYGNYIAYLDADDIWEGGKLICQLNALEKTGACLCNTARRMMTADGDMTEQIMHTPQKITLKMLKKTNYINCSSVLITREAAKKYPMEHARDSHEDYLTWLRLLADVPYVIGIDEPYLLYRLSPDGKSRNKLKAARMTYHTYCYAGYGRVKAFFMLFAYVLYGIRRRR